MYCPVHPDSRRSASINLERGVWFCHAGCGGGSVRQLVDSSDAWVAMEGRDGLSAATLRERMEDAVNTALGRSESLRDDMEGWHEKLLEEPGQMRRLFNLRGINRSTVLRHKIGWDGRYFKIPVFAPAGGGEERELWNVRTYDPSPRFGRRKIWGVRGMNKPRLYPANSLEFAEVGDAILFCEGEWDALLALQNGYLAVTYTCGAGKPWRPEWDIAFAGLRVFLCHDADVQGEKGNEIVGDALCDIAEVFECKLPFPIRPKDGLDITDYLIHQDNAPGRLAGLMAAAKPYERSQG